MRFEINSLEDAQMAARTCQNIVLAFGGGVPPAAPRATRNTKCTETAVSAGSVVPEPVAETVQPEPTTDPAFNRAEVESYVKDGAVARGITWVRANVFDRYNVRKPSELTDAELVELAGEMREADAA